MMIYIAGAIILFAGCMIAWIWVQENILNDSKATTKLVTTRNPMDIRPLTAVLNKGKVGEPLVMYAPVKPKQLENDPYRLTLPVYTVPCEERGLVIGVSGAGKTNFIMAQIADWMKSGNSFVVTDVKPEIFGLLLANDMFELFEYECVVINPTDEKAHKYNMFDDVKNDNDLAELLQMIVPAGNSDNNVFADFARLMLQATIIHLREKDGKVSLTSVFNFVTSFSSGEKYINKLLDDGNNKVKRLTNQAKLSLASDKFVASGINALTNALNFLNNDTIADNVASSDFLLDEYLREPKRAVFLQFEQKDMKSTETLYSTTVQHIIRILMNNNDNRERPVFLLFDELLNGGKIEELAKKFNLIRSFNMPSFLYIQSLAGLINRYGKEEAGEIISACSLQICYRVNDNATAEEFSKFVGQSEAVRYNTSVSPHVRENGSMGEKRTQSAHAEMVNIVPKEMMTTLPSGKALCVFRGQSAIIDIPQHWQDTPLTNKAVKVRLGDF